MTPQRFNAILAQRIHKTKTVLAAKATEYSKDSDRFHNFRVASRILNKPILDVMLGMWVKHLVSILDIVETVKQNPTKITIDLIDEKIGDSINYHILLEAYLKEMIIPGENRPEAK